MRHGLDQVSIDVIEAGVEVIAEESLSPVQGNKLLVAAVVADEKRKVEQGCSVHLLNYN